MRRLKMAIVYVLGVLCVGVFARAAAAQPTLSYTLKVFNQGATQPLSTTTIPAASFTCNAVAPVTTNTANPNKIVFDDPATAGRVCLFTDTGPTGPLVSLPFGSGIYVATIAAVNSAGASPDSALSPTFTQPGTVAPAVTGLKVYR